LNAITVALGGAPHPWDKWVAIAPWNNLFLIVIVIWLQTGYSMVLFSAALKGIPEEMLEAARVDGATEIQLFFRIMIPYIMGTIITVWTTVVIFTLKIFDVVWVMTGGQFGTHVIATQFYRQSFTARNSGVGAAIAIILLVAVIPVMIYNLRQFRQSEAVYHEERKFDWSPCRQWFAPAGCDHLEHSDFGFVSFFFPDALRYSDHGVVENPSSPGMGNDGHL
jgi:alpha-glucoside transport system permease protein